MWIAIDNKSNGRLFKVRIIEKVSFYTSPTNKKYSLEGWGDDEFSYTIGVYATEEQASMVFDMITRAIENGARLVRIPTIEKLEELMA